MQAAFVAGMSLYSVNDACMYMRTKEPEACMHRQVYHMLSAHRHISFEQQLFGNICITWQSAKQALTLCQQSLRCNASGAMQSYSIDAAANPVLTMQICRAGL